MNNLSYYLKFMHAKSKGYRRFIPFIFACTLLFSLLSIFIALVGKQLIDNLLTLNINIILKAVTISVSAFIGAAVLGFFTSYLEKFVIDKLKIKMQLSFYDNMQKSEFIFYSNLSSSDVYYRMFTDIGIMVDFYLNLFITIPIKCIVFVIALGIMLSWSYQLTLAIIALVLLQMLVMLIFRKPIKKRAEIAIESDQNLIAKINEDVLKSDICRSLSLEEYNLKNISTFFEISRKNKLKSSKVTLIYSSIVGLTSQIINICLLLIGIFYVSNKTMTIGMLMGISMLAGYIYQPINDLFKTIISYQPTVVSFKRFEEFDSKVDESRNVGSQKFRQEDIQIKELYFSYDGDYVIENFNTTIFKNKITHLKGENGTGKTTLMRLLSRFVHPYSGSIILGETNINEIDYDDFRKNVVALSSEPTIINATFQENIMLGLEVTDFELNEIIDQCALRDVVESLDNGCLTEMGKGHAGLSKGETQKLALARILIRQPSIVILDEPLSHIDIKSVEEILKTLKEYNTRTGATIIIISHDDRIKCIADDVITLDKLKSN